MEDFVWSITVVQLWFTAFIAVLGFFGFPFVPTLSIYLIYRRFLCKDCPHWLSFLLVLFMVVFALLGLAFVVAEYSYFAQSLYDRYLSRLGILA